MNLYFAGCARDCAKVLGLNILSILSIHNEPWCDDLRIYIAENNSVDGTRDVIAYLGSQDPRIVPIFLDNLDNDIPVREARIALCRDRILDEICKNEHEGLYIPIDLDSDIASSLNANDLVKACRLVDSGRCTGVFPSSFPFYYDIYALRKDNWCPKSCWKEIQDAKAKGSLWSLFVYVRYVSSRQKPHACLQSKDLISIDSAFGGMAIYSLRRVIESSARYSIRDLESENMKLCEHVVFNSFLDRLFIFPELVIKAPPEHIEFRVLSPRRKVIRFIRAALSDLKNLPTVIIKRFGRLLLNHGLIQ